MDAFEAVLRDLALWAYYILDVTREKDSVKAALISGKAVAWNGLQVTHKSVAELAEILRASGKIDGLGELASRFGVRVEASIAAGFVKAAFVDLKDADALADAWGRVLDVVNVPLYQEWEEDTKIALEHMKNRLRYTRLDSHGPRLGEIHRGYIIHDNGELGLTVLIMQVSARRTLLYTPETRSRLRPPGLFAGQ